MWLKLGTYFERDEASRIASKLSEGGARVEIKGAIEWDLEERSFKRVKLSELSGEEREKWELYGNIVRELLRRELRIEDFEAEFLKRVASDKLEVDPFENPDIVTELLDIMSELYSFLYVNGVKISERVCGELPEDPEVIVEADDGEKVYMVTFFPVWDVYVEPASLLRLDAELEDKEALVAELFSRIVSGVLLSESVEDIEELCTGFVEAEEIGVNAIFDGCEVVRELVRYFERLGLIRRSRRK